MNHETFEVNFDGLVGPTHNYSGLSYGNVASMQHQESESNPREAALQGLEKMKFIASLGLMQGVLPPHERPHIPTLKDLGFRGTDGNILTAAFEQEPLLLAEVSSAAAMWTANAATVSSSYDSLDGLVHFVPANLISKFHRSIESDFTSKVLMAIFNNSDYFKHHLALPPSTEFADEGAANHTRFCSNFSSKGIHLFVFGRYAWKTNDFKPKIFPARQTFEASKALARLHQLPVDSIVFAQQNPRAIDSGVFHNDVASVGNRNVFLYHEHALLDDKAILEAIKQKLATCCNSQLIAIKVPEKTVSIEDAVASYLFNSQLVSLNDQTMALIAPIECKQMQAVQTILDEIIADDANPIKEIHYMNLRESMRNGGGPACLRLRIVLSRDELRAAHQGVFFNELLYTKLKNWINKHYRDRLVPKDLADPNLLIEVRNTLDELTKILNLGPIYSFQR